MIVIAEYGTYRVEEPERGRFRVVTLTTSGPRMVIECRAFPGGRHFIGGLHNPHMARVSQVLLDRLDLRRGTQFLFGAIGMALGQITEPTCDCVSNRILRIEPEPMGPEAE